MAEKTKKARKNNKAPCISATKAVAAFTSYFKGPEKYVRGNRNKQEGGNKEELNALESGKKVANLMTHLYNPEFDESSLTREETETLEFFKAKTIIRSIEEKYPTAAGWTVVSEKMIYNRDKTMNAKPDVLLVRGEEIVYVEVKTNLQTKPSFNKFYKQGYHNKKTNRTTVAKYKQHQHQLVFGIHILRDLYPDQVDNINGHVLVCGGNTQRNTYLQWFGLDPLCDSVEFLNGMNLESESLLQSLALKRGAVNMEQVAIQIPSAEIETQFYFDSSDLHSPQVCAVDSSGVLYGVYGYKQYAGDKTRARFAVASSSICDNPIVLFS